ncbi:GTPase Era [Campylobacter concisus]|uniref:GTPase Era n=3 Tax=Campylobacter concisus TaxID=199 RepID=ERA_CAMC1|nr:GTPase Era [Campylobacter concisus]A7ZDF6.1 RecName: Full=GTPase Era [Campylobacter concisus 13826]EAT98676.1 GTP-binding protein [Campylobacter concisus 13826]MBS5809547.1 GTPase Era [Campylobacter concisus]MCA6130137.1 GTPase Era [Campylobacter concisus]MCA6133038.1 GTPase Era [Campylobacter concisus]OUT07783.1 GTPase Era [Campylobacter concisus]
MKSGFVSIIGRTNAGKSSFLNALLNEKIAIVSHKQNATRRKINGIVMNGEDQIIFTDTPGLHESNKAINQLLISQAIKSMGDCDLIVFLAPIHDDTSDYEKFLALNPEKPHILVLTKVDESSNAKVLEKITKYQKFQDKFAALLTFSTKQPTYKKPLLDEICKLLPEHEYFYDPEFLTPTNEKEIFREFILEAIYENLSDEIPYLSDAIIKSVKEKTGITEIYASIITERDIHKSMIIGKNGETIKRIGIFARKLIQNLTNTKVFLKLDVVVKKGWSKEEKSLNQIIGY